MLNGKKSDEQIQALLDLALERDDKGKIVGRSKIGWDDLVKTTGIGYSRGWLLVERALMESLQPTLLIHTDQEIAKAKEAWNALSDKQKEDNPFSTEDVLGVIVRRCRIEDGNSWGLISVRMGIPESRVSRLFEKDGVLKRKGLRIGKGGRWVLDDQSLYTAHRVKEGAAIDVAAKLSEIRGHPDRLVNAEERLTAVLPSKVIVSGAHARDIAESRAKRNAAAKAKRPAKPKEVPSA